MSWVRIEQPAKSSDLTLPQPLEARLEGLERQEGRGARPQSRRVRVRAAQQPVGHVQELAGVARSVLNSGPGARPRAGSTAGRARPRRPPSGRGSPRRHCASAPANGSPASRSSAGEHVALARPRRRTARAPASGNEALRLAQGPLDLGVGLAAPEPPPPHDLHARGLERRAGTAPAPRARPPTTGRSAVPATASASSR